MKTVRTVKELSAILFIDQKTQPCGGEALPGQNGNPSYACMTVRKGDLQMEILKVRQIHKIYGEKENKVHALKDVSFTVRQGEFIAIVGTSGSGGWTRPRRDRLSYGDMISRR